MIILCMIYYPCVKQQSSWAQHTLLNYDQDPQPIQKLIQEIYNRATKKVKIDGIIIKTIPLYEILDCNNDDEYDNRVEPSSKGGQKMAIAFSKYINIH